MDLINLYLNEVIRQQIEYTEMSLAEIIQNYDFIVGSKELKFKMLEIMPDNTNIICSPYVESPTTIFAIKKFDLTDLLHDTGK